MFWRVAVVFLVKIIQSFIQKVVNWEEAKTRGYLAIIILLVMGTDLILTTISLEIFHIGTKRWDERLNTRIGIDEGRFNQRFDKLVGSLS